TSPEAAASRVTYLTGLSRPVNRPQWSRHFCLPMAGMNTCPTAEGSRKNCQMAGGTPAPRLAEAQIPRHLRLAVRAAVSRATKIILPPAITAARGGKRRLFAFQSAVAQRRQD